MTKHWPLLLLLALAVAARATATPKPRRAKNPRTGEPIVSNGSRQLTREEIRALLVGAGFADVERGVQIAWRESGGFADVAVDTRGMTPDELRAYWGRSARPELSVGLFQINLLANSALVPGDDEAAKFEALKDPETNVAIAHKLSSGGRSWQAWGG